MTYSLRVYRRGHGLSPRCTEIIRTNSAFWARAKNNKYTYLYAYRIRQFKGGGSVFFCDILLWLRHERFFGWWNRTRWGRPPWAERRYRGLTGLRATAVIHRRTSRRRPPRDFKSSLSGKRNGRNAGFRGNVRVITEKLYGHVTWADAIISRNTGPFAWQRYTLDFGRIPSLNARAFKETTTTHIRNNCQKRPFYFFSDVFFLFSFFITFTLDKLYVRRTRSEFFTTHVPRGCDNRHMWQTLVSFLLIDS